MLLIIPVAPRSFASAHFTRPTDFIRQHPRLLVTSFLTGFLSGNLSLTLLLGCVSPFFLSTNKKFSNIFSTSLIKNSYTFYFSSCIKKIGLQIFRLLYSSRTKSRSNVRVIVLARSNVLAQTNETEIVLLRKFKRFLFSR